MTDERFEELTERYGITWHIENRRRALERAARTARGYLWATDDSQPVDDDTLRADIIEIEVFLARADNINKFLKESKE